MTMIRDGQINGRWHVLYARSAALEGPGLTVRYFRCSFALDSLPETYPVFVTADSRYRLWVNGQGIGRGPLKGTFITCILGIQPLKPGFSKIQLAPHIEVTQFAEGSAPTPHGMVVSVLAQEG